MATVAEVMNRDVLAVDPTASIGEAAEKMMDGGVGAVVVMEDMVRMVGIITERDILNAIGAGVDPDAAMVDSHTTGRGLVFAAPRWSLEEAAAAMVKGAFRHLIVVDEGQIIGILAMRDIVRCWTDDGAICEVPASAALSG